MIYKSYQHVEKLGTSDVIDILNGDVYLFYKIDGTNACIWLKDDNTIGFGSRNREIDLDQDNYGFRNAFQTPQYADVLNDITNFLTQHPNYIIYGEWLVPISLKTYKEDAWRTFYLFDILDTETDRYINYEEYSSILDNNFPNIKYIPLIAKLTNPTEEQVKQYLDNTGDWLIKDCKGLGEGIVIKNYAFVNRYGRTTWAKVLTEDYKNSKKENRIQNHVNKELNPVEYNIIKLMTKEHVLKEKSKIEETYGGWSQNNMYELLNRTFIEFWKDNWEIILKKFKLPTIDFKKLKSLSDEFIKKVIDV